MTTKRIKLAVVVQLVAVAVLVIINHSVGVNAVGNDIRRKNRRSDSNNDEITPTSQSSTSFSYGVRDQRKGRRLRKLFSQYKRHYGRNKGIDGIDIGSIIKDHEFSIRDEEEGANLVRGSNANNIHSNAHLDEISRGRDLDYYNNVYYNNVYYNKNNNKNYYQKNNNDDDDDGKDQINDDANAVADEKVDDQVDDDKSQLYKTDNLCTKYLISFLEGTTDAKDNCEGYQNAYVAAYCKDFDENTDDDHDDYFLTYNHISCCQFLKGHYDAYCDDTEIITNMHLLLIASILLLCEMAKSLIKTHQLHWLPEAGGCIIVGTLFGFFAHLTPHLNVDDLSFNEDLFLCILLPPIIFEAALSVNKHQFRRRRLAIFMFAAIGTILSTFMTGIIVHFGSYYFSTITIPLLDSFIFGALISSIDPVAILSVLTSLNLTERDTIYIMVFGESLLNDGVAITLFKTLLAHYDSESSDVTADEVLGTIADFLIVGVGSILIGLICGFAALIYFWFLRKKLTPTMEVGSFFLWAGIPYYICDECNLSGIVAIVTIGFFMDIYIAKPKDELERLDGDYSLSNGGNSGGGHQRALKRASNSGPGAPYYTNSGSQPRDNFTFNGNGGGVSHSLRHAANDHYVDLGDSTPCNPENLCGVSPSGRSIYSLRSLKSFRTLNVKELLLREERFRLTVEADRHVRFVAGLLSSLSENCIFVYLGLFLYSKKYVWDLSLMSISIFSCILSRAAMVVIVCHLVWYLNILRQRGGCYKPTTTNNNVLSDHDSLEPQVSRTATSLQDKKIQLVLVLAGLRGAVSLALVESVPIYNGVNGTGSNYKGEMKAMTSASIMFTIFVIGGSSYYILRHLNISSDGTSQEGSELTPIAEKRSPRFWKEAPKPEESIRKPQLNNVQLPPVS